MTQQNIDKKRVILSFLVQKAKNLAKAKDFEYYVLSESVSIALHTEKKKKVFPNLGDRDEERGNK